MRKKDVFTQFANHVSHWFGKPISFILAVIVIVTWALTGPLFHFSETWQLIINTGTTIVTFLMVFVIQNTQNRDNAAIQIKLDEIIRAMEPANNSLLDLENLSQDDLEKIRGQYLELAKHARDEIEKRKK